MPPTPPDQLAARLCDGSLRPADLSIADRRRCVEHLTEQGLTLSEIASVMRFSRRTVCRDRRALRRRDAIHPDGTLGDELLGEYDRLTQNSIARLTRLARDADAPPTVRCRAERDLLAAYRQFIELSQSMRYIEDGQRRLRDQRDNDPTQPSVFQRDLRAIARMAAGV